MDNLKSPIEVIDPWKPNQNQIFLMDVIYEMFPDKETKLFLKDQHFVVWRSFYNKFEKAMDSTQQEFPLISLSWFIDTIEEKFLNHKPNLLDLPGEVSESVIIDNEKIGINPMKNCCAENIFGYSFWNASRKNHLTDITPQEWQIPRYMLEQGLLDELKAISARLGLKTYS